MSPRPRPRAPRYWLLLVFAALLLSPPAWATIAIVCIGLGGLALPALRRFSRAGGRERDRGELAARGTVLGADSTGRQVVLSDRQLSAHTVILGASGAGKSTTMLSILTDHVRRGRPVVALDMKGSPAFARELAAAAAAAGRPFRLWTPDGPGHWNPLAHGNATELKDKLIATERFTEPHYQRAAERYVQIALQALHQAHPELPATLDAVVEVMDPARLAGLGRDLPPDRAERLRDYLSTLTPDQLSAVRGLGTRLAILSESHSGEFLSPPGTSEAIDLRRALAGEEVVLFSLNSSTYGKLAAQIGTLVVQDLIAAAGYRLNASLSPDEQAIVAIDEFSALGADHVVSLVVRGREAGIPVLLATQELADLERAAPGLRDQVLGSTAVKIVHRQDVPSSALTVAQMAGTIKTWEETRQIGGRLFGGHDTGRGTLRPKEEFRVHPDEIKSLRTGEAVLITKLPRARVRTVRVTPPRHERGGPELG
jgi:conjugal transfer pilus assembly protein TraD